MRSQSPKSSVRLLFAFCLVVAGLVWGAAGPVSAAITVPNDGSTQARAAASCWEAKQVNPAATDGIYWLNTPALQVPTQFYCDQTTDGGGWVLIGRGRTVWSSDYDGQGTTAQVAQTVTGTAAFSVRQLGGAVINGLLNNGRVDAMADGIRLRRATNIAGTSWQEVRFSFRNRDRWSWALGAGHPLTTYSFNGVTRTGSTSRDFGIDNNLLHLRTYATADNNWYVGMNYGSQSVGSTAATSYVFTATANGHYASPFTQMFIRPKLMTANLNYPNIPNSGTAAQTAPSIVKSGAIPSTWGVTGLGAGGTQELATEVSAFAQIGNTMYVGGNFTAVQNGQNATGSDKISQSYLAAFNATTGAWIPGFRPTFNNQVKALAALPNGNLAVGGNFTTVNGQARAGLVALDPTTGATDASWQTNMINNIGGGTAASVRTLDVAGSWLYVGGYFTHIVGGGSSTQIFARNAGRVNVGTGAPDANWNPNFNGTVVALDVSDDNTRVYFGGYFTTSNDVTTQQGAAISTAPGAPVVTPMWNVVFSTPPLVHGRYQQAVQEVGNYVWLGGSEHSMFAYNRNDFSLAQASITRAGGDLQSMDGSQGVVYGGCHCDDWNYVGNTDWTSQGTGSTNVTWTEADRIGFVGAWNAATTDYMPQFTPRAQARNGMGAWAILGASDGTLWVGGSFTSVVTENGANQWVGGFMRFGMRPHTAPDAPSGLTASLDGTNATLNWTASSSSGVSYEVLRNDRVVASTTARTVTVPDSTSTDRFFVRASDGQGNRSVSTPATVPVAAPHVVNLVDEAASWAWNYGQSTVDPATWTTEAFDDSSWQQGPAPLGFGSSTITTNIDVPTGTVRPITAYFRRRFTVADPSQLSNIVATSYADDGIVIYLNGVEIGRKNMPDGPVTANTYATAGPRTSTALASPLVLNLDKSQLVTGTNVVAVEVHLNYKSTPDAGMKLSLTAQQ